MNPVYLSLSKKEIEERAKHALAMLRECHLCPRGCGVNRIEGETGFCQTGRYALVASYSLHFGEEAPLVGERGSGTIFFAGCNLGCVFCQNYEISHSTLNAYKVNAKQLASIMISLQDKGACNINFVSPSHVVPQILEALVFAVDMGLTIPLVYNTGSYDRVETLALLEGICDIYMPDTKVFSPIYARKYLGAEDYGSIARRAIKEMHRQVGDLEIGREGIALHGLLVRHLLMPGDIAGTREWLEFIAREISVHTYLNIMDQYRPCGDAYRFPELCFSISYQELKEAKRLAISLGLNRLHQQDISRMLFFIDR